jgi:putative Mg2+ transporter-C (MgtC) family protein
MRTDSGVQGLTTAATVWVNAALGVAVGGGEYHLALIGTAVTLTALLLLHPIEQLLDRQFRRPETGEKSREATDS